MKKARRTAHEAAQANGTPHGVKLLSSGEIRTLADDLGIRPSKHRGQNFVTDANTIRRIVRTAGIEGGDVVLEIGPGLGSLTLGLLEDARHVLAVEIDPVLARALPSTVDRHAPDRGERLTVVRGDALRLSRRSEEERARLPEPDVLVANLPYNVAVPVLLHMLAEFPSLSRGLVMVQLEVAERLAAGPGRKAYGVPSAKLAWYAETRQAGLVGRGVFWPQPRVDSGLVAFTRTDPPATSVGRAQVFAVVDAAFAQRRKTLRGALAGLFGSPDRAEAALRSAGVDPSARGERLEIGEFTRIAEQLPPASPGPGSVPPGPFPAGPGTLGPEPLAGPGRPGRTGTPGAL